MSDQPAEQEPTRPVIGSLTDDDDQPAYDLGPGLVVLVGITAEGYAQVIGKPVEAAWLAGALINLTEAIVKGQDAVHVGGCNELCTPTNHFFRTDAEKPS